MRQLVLAHCPFSLDLQDKVRISKKLNLTLAMTVRNTSLFAKQLDQHFSVCRCDEARMALGDAFSDHSVNGHLRSFDPTAVAWLCPDDLRELFCAVWRQGSKFRGSKPPEEAIHDFSLGLHALAKVLIAKEPKSQDLIDTWIKTSMQNYRTQCTADKRNFYIPFRLGLFFAQLKSTFVVTTLDKNPQALCIACSVVLRDSCLQYVANPSTFREFLGDTSTIIAEHVNINNKYGFLTPNVLSHIYPVVKLHKDRRTTQQRYIAGISAKSIVGPEHNKQSNKLAVESSLTALGRKLATFFDAIIDLAVLNDRLEMKAGKPRRIFNIRDPC